MNKYQAGVRIKGQLVKTAVFADSPIHARLMLQYQFGMDSIAAYPTAITEVATITVSYTHLTLPTNREV